MNNGSQGASRRAARVWLGSAAFWFTIAFVASALTYVGRADEQGQPLPFSWEAFYSLDAFLMYLPYVPGTVWLWYESTRLVVTSGRRSWLRGVAAAAIMGGVTTACFMVRHRLDNPLPLTLGMWMWSSLQYLAVLGAGVAHHARQLVATRERELLTTQLRALRAQLQPHFLFNTLHTIGVTCKQDGATAARMTTLLGDLLRQTLREREGGVVSLAEEHELLQAYLQLQQLRFADRLRVDVDLPPEVLAGAVPDLLLQPLVENALQHGIEQRPGSGHVRVVGRRVGDHLLIDVHDDGVGVAANAGEPVLGTGLGATKARLAALYGDRASLSLRANDRGGTTASVILPWREVAHAA